MMPGLCEAVGEAVGVGACWGGMTVDGSGRVQLLGPVQLLYPEQQTFDAMLNGRRQPAALPQPPVRHDRQGHRLRPEVCGSCERVSLELVTGPCRRVFRLRRFTSYVSNPDYGWDLVCEQRCGTHPAQVFFDWNTASHVQEFKGSPSKRPFTRHELQMLFDHADDQVGLIVASGRKLHRAKIVLQGQENP